MLSKKYYGNKPDSESFLPLPLTNGCANSLPLAFSLFLAATPVEQQQTIENIRVRGTQCDRGRNFIEGGALSELADLLEMYAQIPNAEDK